MISKPVLLRKLAAQDVEDAVAHYANESAVTAALGFVDALQKAFAHVGRLPATGSYRYAHELDLPGLRTWPVTRFPYLIFYREEADHVDVWRILHESRDHPASLI